MYARIKTAVAARAARVAAFDTPWVDIKNLEGLNMFVASSKSLGFTGAHAIHPVISYFEGRCFCFNFFFRKSLTSTQSILGMLRPKRKLKERSRL